MTAPLDHEDRDRQIQEILNAVRAQRMAGHDVRDEDIVSRHPNLMPELIQRLILLKKITASLAVDGPNKEGKDDASIIASSELSSGHSRQPFIVGYELLPLIRRGGQASVFLAIQQATSRKVAVKVLEGGAFISPQKYARLEREIKALAAIDHPGIIHILDRGCTADGSFYIAIDYVEGEDLDEYLRQRQLAGWNTRQVIELFIKIAVALGEAHRLGIVHRDVKPSNIRIDLRGEPRILDFGLARLTSPINEEEYESTVTQTGGVVGSLPWSSPEQASGDADKICPASDVYSLGVVLFRTLTAESPYDLSGTLRQQMHNICEVIPTIPVKSDSSLPFGAIDASLASVILKCLEKSPEDRYSNGAELTKEFDDYISGRLPEKPSESSRHRRLILACAMTIAIFGATVAMVATRVIDRSNDVLVIALPTYRNSLSMEMVLIPARSFRFGNVNSNNVFEPNEQSHEVTLSHSYYMSSTEVTRGEYRKIMGALPSGVVQAKDDELPVDRVSRMEAEEFCKHLSRNEGRNYRLPTEAEWENACRAGTNTSVSGTGRIEDMAWYEGNSEGQLHRVSSKQPNNWGLYDTQGNVAEWCADRFVNLLGSDPVVDPFAPPTSHSRGVVRGGSYSDLLSRCRAAARLPLGPEQNLNGIGFRVVMDVPTARGNGTNAQSK